MSNKVRKWIAILMSVLMLLQMIPAGAAAATCPKCGSADYASGYDEWWEDATCTKPGRVEHSHCYTCEYHEFEDVPALGHNWDEWKSGIATTGAGRPATCTEPGMQVRYCLRCKAMETREEAALGHDWSDWVDGRTRANCTQSGIQTRYCRRCQLTQEREVAALGHNFGDWRIQKEATCTDPGEEARQCQRCGLTETHATPALGHIWGEVVQVQEGTCLEHAKGRQTCSRCGTWKTVPLELGDHRWGEWHQVKRPTVKQKGLEERVCSICSKVEQRELDMLNCTGSLLLEVVSAPSVYYADSNGLVNVVYRLTNTGNTTLTANSSRTTNGANEAVQNQAYSENSNGRWSALVPGDSFEITHGYKPTEAEIAAGQIVRRFTHGGLIWFDSNGMPMNWEGAASPYGADHENPITSNTVTVTVPLVDYNGSMLLELVSAPGAFYGKAGDTIDVVYRLTNTGNTTLSAHSYNVWDGAGQSFHDFTKDSFADMDWFKPGTSGEITFHYTVTEDDINRGQIERTVKENGLIWVGNNGIPVGWEGSEGATSYRGNENKPIESNTVTVTVPLGDYTGSMLLELVSAPGIFYGKAGDTMDVVYRLTNTGNTTLTANSYNLWDGMGADVLDAVYSENSGSRWSNFVPGDSFEITLSFKPTEAEIAAGEVVRTFRENGYIWVSENGVPMNWEDPYVAAGSVYETNEDKPIHSNEVTVTIPVRDLDYTGSLYVELISAPAFLECGAGEQINLTYRVTNTGDTTLCSDAYAAYGGSGQRISASASANTPDGANKYLAPGQSYETVFTFPVTSDDLVAGQFVCRYLRAAYVLVGENGVPVGWEGSSGSYHKDSRAVYSNSVTAIVPVDEKPFHLIVEKELTNAPQNGAYFVPGETAVFTITLRNEVGAPVYKVKLTDVLGNATGTVNTTLSEMEVMDAGVERTFVYTYTITQADAEQGYVENWGAYAARPTPDGRIYENFSNLVYVPCGEPGTQPPEHRDGEVVLAKTVTSTPANGLYYVPDEVIHYEVSLLSAPSQLVDVVVKDVLASTPLATLSSMTFDGTPISWTFDYTVTEWDGLNGSVTNVATLDATDWRGNSLSASASLTLPTGLPGGFGVITEMTITKQETSTPANGSYYTKGETITYDIVIRNDGEVDFGECILYDSLAASDISSVEHLYVSEERHFPFSHTVTAADVAAGCVYNTAWVTYNIDLLTQTQMSNTVVSDTDGIPDPINPGDTGTIMTPELPAGYVPCSHMLVAKGENGQEYRIHYCDGHVDTQKKVRELVDAAVSEGERLSAWTEARKLWQAEIDQMYEELLSAADPMAKISLMDDRIRFYAAIGCHEQLLNKLAPQAPWLVASVIAEEMADKSVSMCYAMHTAPNDRVDAFRHASDFDLNLAPGEDCFRSIKTLADGHQEEIQQLCAHHAVILQMRNRLVTGSENAEEAWKNVRQLWRIQVNTGYNQLYVTLGEELKAAVLADYKAFENSINAHEKVLHALYGRPEVVDEVCAQAMMERAMEICSLK